MITEKCNSYPSPKKLLFAAGGGYCKDPQLRISALDATPHPNQYICNEMPRKHCGHPVQDS